MNLSPPAKHNHRRHERDLAFVALVTLIAAWFIRAARQNTKIEPFLQQALPVADRFEPLANETYAAYAGDVRLSPVAIGKAVSWKPFASSPKD